MVKDNFWQHRNVFVTGATGILGSWVTKLLVKKQANVVCLMRDSVPKSALFLGDTTSRLTIVRGQLEDYLTLERILGEYEIDTVIHLAAQTIAPIANRNPLSTFETNIKGTWNMLEACRRSPLVKRILVASSDKAYGSSKVLPYTEDTPLLGRFPYDASKSCADLLAQSYYYSYQLPVCITRCGNLFGGGDLNFNRLVPSIIRSALYGERPVLRSDGSFIRDYFYVEDAAAAVLEVIAQMEEKKLFGEAFNLSNETPISVLDMTKMILKKMGSKLTPVIKNESSNEIPKQYLSSKKAREVLSWKPTYTLDEGIEKTIKWYKNFFAKQDVK